MTLIALFEGLGAVEVLRYDRAAITEGEWWRLLSTHLVHLGPAHAALNAAVLVAVMLLVGRTLRSLEWLGLGLVSALFTSAGVWFLVPEIERFAGLSGVLHGLMIAGALASWPQQRLLAGTLLAFLAGKLTWELFAGPTPGTADLAGGPVLVESHLLGALPGALWGGIRLLLADRRAAID